jgi:hypothetical protein
MTRTRNIPTANGSSDAPRIEQLIVLIKELTSVVLEENLLLAQGVPASRSKQIARKTELAALLEKWVAEVTSRKLNIQTRDERLRREFHEHLSLLKEAMDDNIVQLRAAIEASQRRIDAVMGAIREQMAGSSSYTSSGRMRSQTASRSIGTNIHA